MRSTKVQNSSKLWSYSIKTVLIKLVWFSLEPDYNFYSNKKTDGKAIDFTVGFLYTKKCF
jgi:hypothetical protein